MEKISGRIQPGKAEVVLTKRDQRAFIFIKSNKETPPSIRDITRHLGLKSSRSGYQVVKTLVEKGVVKKGRKGELACP